VHYHQITNFFDRKYKKFFLHFLIKNLNLHNSLNSFSHLPSLNIHIINFSITQQKFFLFFKPVFKEMEHIYRVILLFKWLSPK